MTRARFDRQGPLAIAPFAMGQEYEIVPPAPPAQEADACVLQIIGPITHHGDWFCGGDTYDAIEMRMQLALATNASTVVMKFDSPGGEVDGAFECARTLRRMAAAAGKRLIAYVDEAATSAAYALACAAEKIYLPASARCGSIGVVSMVVDATAADAQSGLRFSVMTSGARKADGNPHVPITDEAKAFIQAEVDAFAVMFFELVAEMRGLSPDAIAAQQAQIFRGKDAVAAGLADGVANWDHLLAMLAGGADLEPPAAPVGAATTTESDMTRAELLAALKAAMAEEAPAEPEKKDEGDEAMSKDDLVAAIKAALAEEEPAEEPAKPAPPAPPAKEPDGDEAKAKALSAAAGAQAARPTPPADAGLPPGQHYLPNASAATTTITALEARVNAMEAEKRAAAEATERANLIASVQMSDATRKWLTDPTTTIADVRAACKALPAAMPPNPAAAALAMPTPAQGQASAHSGVDASVVRQLNSMMGLPVAESGEIRWGGQTKDPGDTTTEFDRVFPTAMGREEAKAILKRNEERLRASSAALGNTIGGGR